MLLTLHEDNTYGIFAFIFMIMSECIYYLPMMFTIYTVLSCGFVINDIYMEPLVTGMSVSGPYLHYVQYVHVYFFINVLHVRNRIVLNAFQYEIFQVARMVTKRHPRWYQTWRCKYKPIPLTKIQIAVSKRYWIRWQKCVKTCQLYYILCSDHVPSMCVQTSRAGGSFFRVTFILVTHGGRY